MEKREIKEAADRILHTYGLLDLLRPLGTPHVIGSYRMDMMAGTALSHNVTFSLIRAVFTHGHDGLERPGHRY